jgi:hypothetical protein
MLFHHIAEHHKQLIGTSLLPILSFVSLSERGDFAKGPSEFPGLLTGIAPFAWLT